ncbi:NUDIX domain-containing protein [Candidatus Dependentiae bacterium]|nr:NUDIX domain-containing protein [Candidatus Dependentiae bacterium]
MDKTYHSIIPAVFVVFKRGNTFLVGRRKGSWGNGLLCLPGGHVEQGESFRVAAKREMLEEVGLDIEIDNLVPLHVMHRKNQEGQERIDVYFMIESWSGEPVNKEPSKCFELLWIPFDQLPTDVVAILKDALSLSSRGVFYSEQW